VPDYSQYVAPDKEMNFNHITFKLSRLEYSSLQEFEADVHLVHTNCEAYNSAGGGAYCSVGKLSLPYLRHLICISHQGVPQHSLVAIV